MNNGFENAFGKVLALSGRTVNTYFGTKNADYLAGTDLNDIMRGYGGGDTFVGGLGDDTYISASREDLIFEAAGEGIDTIRTSIYRTLDANVENLILEGRNAWFGGGNELDNIIIGNDFDQIIDGRAGNDVLIGKGGADTFVISAGNGSDVILDFQSGLDLVRLAGYGITSFDQVQGAASQSGADTVIRFGNGESLVLRGVEATSLIETDFTYELDTSALALSFADEFDTLSLLSEGGTWRTEYGNGGAGSVTSRTLRGESQVYMDPDWAGTGTEALGVNPFSIDDGILTITAAPASEEVLPYIDGHTYTSGLLTTKFTYAQQYGYFEIRAALPEGQGLWPAFWLLRTDNRWPPEIDVFEMLGRDPEVIYMTSHEVNEEGEHVWSQKRAVLDTSEFHTYGVDWSADELIYYIDGSEIGRIPTPPDMNAEMYMLVNLAVGGATSWGGGADETTGIGEMKVDYVRAYRTADTVSTTINGVKQFYGDADAIVQAPVETAPIAEEPVVEAPAAPAIAEVFEGGAGNDTFTITSNQQRVVERANGGVDVINASVSYTLPDNVETLVLAEGSAIDGTGNALNNRMIGNAMANVLMGMDGDDYLDGAGGADTLIGGRGNDVYRVCDAMVKIEEKSNEGNDLVIAEVDFILPENVENLRFEGDADLRGTGNAENNRMIGNAGNNVLDGKAGNDYLDGGEGANTLIGGLGNDVMVVNNAETTVIERAGEGKDSVHATVSYVLPDNVEFLFLKGNDDINGAGNQLDNKVFGNDGANWLKGEGGDDWLSGGKGDDGLIGGAGNDRLTGGEGADSFVFQGRFGNDVIDDFVVGEDSLVLVGFEAGDVSLSHSGKDTVLTIGNDSITLSGQQGLGIGDIDFIKITDNMPSIEFLI